VKNAYKNTKLLLRDLSTKRESIECFIHFQSEWSLFLPSDRWVYLWDEKEEIVAGPKLVTVIAPMGKTPVFYRADSKWTLLFGDVRRLFNF